jgi:hypothetical protein
MRKLSTFGKITFYVGCMVAILGCVGSFSLLDDSPLVPNPSLAIGGYVPLGILLMLSSFFYKKRDC